MSKSEAPFRRTIDLHLAEPEGAPTLRRALNEAGCAVSPIGLDEAPGPAPEVVLADLRHAGAPMALAGQARKAAGASPLILVVGEHMPAGLEGMAERALLVQAPGDAAPVLRAVAGVVRAGDLAREAGVRLAAMTVVEQALGQDAGHPIANKVALLAVPGPLAMETLRTLGDEFDSFGVLSRAQALRALEAGEVGALVISPGKTRRDAAALVRLVRRQSVLRDTPIVVVEKRRTVRHLAFWNAAEVDGCFTPQESGLLSAALRGGLRRRAVMKRLGGFLERTITCDAGANSRIAGTSLFDACLAERCDRGGAFAIGALSLSPASGAADDEAFDEAALYLSFGVEPEDLMTRPCRDLFLFQINAADRRGSARTMSALQALIADLKFGREDAPVGFRSRFAATSWQPGDTPERLVVRAVNALADPVTPERLSLVPAEAEA